MLVYTKKEFNAIIDNHPEFFDDGVKNPDDTYNFCKCDDFASEAGQDEYYVLYAYFLKQRNGTEKYAERRQKFIDIFMSLNYLFCQFEDGGTYFGHQGIRIIGYVEYVIHEYIFYENSISKTYNITKQKNLYMQSLRQLIRDESEINTVVTEKQEKDKWLKELNKAVDSIERNITDIFYLRKAQEFQYCYYNYFD